MRLVLLSLCVLVGGCAMTMTPPDVSTRQPGAVVAAPVAES